jgi:serine/threonine-protein kinase
MDRELQAIRLATSPNLVQPENDRVSAASIGGMDCLWYAEEFIEGTLIQDIAAPWEFGQIIGLGLDLGHAIEALWEHRIVHRDIKPDNVIRATEGRFVLLDAGVARHQTLESITLAEGRPGTAFWRSPEQLRRYRRELDFRSDLFLVGQLMYCSATNAHPFLIDVETEEEYERRVIEGDFTKVEQLREDIPISLAAVINRSLARNPHGRYRAISKFRQALEVAREEI